MLFSEVYSVYYNVVSRIINIALEKDAEDLKKNKAKYISEIVKAYGFADSNLYIGDADVGLEAWRIITEDGKTLIKNKPYTPLTIVQRRWLKSIMSDPRLKLFTDDVYEDDEVEVLFTEKDFRIFDSYADGDDYESEHYIKIFRYVLEAIKKNSALDIEFENQSGNIVNARVWPNRLEYSEKDDKFRLYGAGDDSFFAINLGRIISCKKLSDACDSIKANSNLSKTIFEETGYVTFELIDERNALERVLMHFAHFKKDVEKIDDDRYKVKVEYYKSDEAELVIRVLSFGPVITVLEPSGFIDLIREKLVKQKAL